MLVVIRHGRALGNTSHRLNGWADVPLDDVGRKQAELVATRLERAGIERIVSSDIARALETARPLAGRIGLEVEIDEQLREIDNGAWTGLLPEEIAERWPGVWQEYVDGADVARPEGERWADVRRRVRTGLEALVEDGRVTAVFTHGGPVMLSAEWALGLELPGNIFHGPLAAPSNSSITLLEGKKLIAYADAGHLGGMSRIDVPYAPA